MNDLNTQESCEGSSAGSDASEVSAVTYLL
jgi:hypothetical protein